MNLLSRVMQDEWGYYILIENIKKHPKHFRVSAKDRRKMIKESNLATQARKMGLLVRSKAFQSFLKGEISEKEARRIGEITNARHACTNYESLLREGIDRDTARKMVQEKMNEVLGSHRKKT